MLGAVSASASAGMHIVTYRRPSSLSPLDADFNPLGDRVTQKIMTRDDTGAANESVRKPEGPSYKALPPVSFSLPLPAPMSVPMNSPVKEHRKVPLWRRFFQYICCSPTPNTRLTAENSNDAGGVRVSASTPPSTALDAILSIDTLDHNTLNSYVGKFLLLRPSDGKVTREDASVQTRAGSAHRQLIYYAEMKLGTVPDSSSICNGRSVFSLAPDVMKVRLEKRPVCSDSYPMEEHEASHWGEAEQSQDATVLQDLKVADVDSDGCEVERLFEIAVVAYQDLRVLVCTPSTAASDTVATHSMNSDIRIEIAGAGAGAEGGTGTGTEVETSVGVESGTRAGTGTETGVGKVLSSPVIRSLSPASQAAWKHFYIFCSICLGGVLSDTSSCQSVRSRSLQWNLEQNVQQLRM